jgi:RNA-binding protein YlmH
MNRDEKSLQKRIAELADRSYSQGRYIYTDFLNASELSQFYEMEGQLTYVPHKVFGGMEESERCVVRFGDAEMCGYEEAFPIACIRMEPLMQKFADSLSHRDFLGALMNLGITREKLGDIIIQDNVGYLFCLSSISDYIIDNLSFVKHTHIRCSLCQASDSLSAKELREVQLIVSSNRADAAVARLYKLSREQALILFREKKVFLNGRVLENNSQTLKPEDVLSVRGHGKFIFRSQGGTTQKGRLYVTVAEYI